MLTIRREQFAVFKPIAEEVFITSVVDYIRKAHGVRTIELPDGAITIDAIADATLRTMVKGGIEQARRYDLTSKSAITSYVVLMFLTAPNFDHHPLIQHTLLDEGLDPNLRFDELWQRTVDQNWIAVRQSYDPSEWQLKTEETGT